jgi:hypothetical protein
MISIIDLVLSLLGTVLQAFIKSGAPQEIITGIQDAIASLTAVQGTPVTYAQLESLRATATWGNPTTVTTTTTEVKKA